MDGTKSAPATNTTATSSNTATGMPMDMDCFTQPLPPSQSVMRSNHPSAAALNGALSLLALDTGVDSYMDMSSGNGVISTNAGNTTPNSGSNMGGGGPSPKPEKVKSRWRRNSELESGHKMDNGSFEGHGATTLLSPVSSTNTTTIMITRSHSQNLSNISTLSSSTTSASSAIHNASTATTVNTLLSMKDTPSEPLPEFESIEENIYLFERYAEDLIVSLMG